jgi:RNA polymerase sigma-70 factor (ECF subfamily)
MAWYWKHHGIHVIVACVRTLKEQLLHLKRILLHRGASREDAEDLVQEAVLRLHMYARAGGRVHDQEAFVTRCALNLAVDAYRHSRGDLYEREPVEDLNLADMGPTPDEVFAAEQRLLRMRQTLDRVSLRTREIFFMHRLQGYSHAEIASKLQVSKSAVEKHIASAVTILAMERQRK